jgi:SAM-dependent methyltransferase
MIHALLLKQETRKTFVFSDASFDQCVALLVMRFIPDALKAVKEMRRVTRRGGTVATAMWDTTGGNELNDVLTEAALILDPKADPKPPSDKDTPGTYGSQQDLSSLWAAAGLTNIETTSLSFRCRFESFNDFWQPLTEGQGPAGAYLRAISADRRNALRNLLRERILGSGVDGPLTLRAKAWVVRGVVP